MWCSGLLVGWMLCLCVNSIGIWFSYTCIVYVVVVGFVVSFEDRCLLVVVLVVDWFWCFSCLWFGDLCCMMIGFCGLSLCVMAIGFCFGFGGLLVGIMCCWITLGLWFGILVVLF